LCRNEFALLVSERESWLRHFHDLCQPAKRSRCGRSRRNPLIVNS
jgi:hypothetical protein